MALTHTNEVVYKYTAGGTTYEKTATRSESSGAEINLSETLTTDSSTDTTALTIAGFEFATKAKAKSVYFRMDCATADNGADASVVITDQSGGAVVTLIHGQPYTWSDNGGNNFPLSTSANPLNDSITALTVTPAAGIGTSKAVTITAFVLYDPT